MNCVRPPFTLHRRLLS